MFSITPRKFLFPVLAAAPALLFWVGPAQAQDGFAGIEEVMVTAQKREETLQDVPIAVTVFDADAVRDFGISDIKTLGSVSASLQTPSFPTTNNNLGFFIRGAGNADSNILTRDNTVGIYFDGVYQGRTTGLLADLVDLERIEILRGPQGSLYGRNTVAGAVNFISARPTGEFGFRQELSIGKWNYVRSRTIIDLPASGGFKAKLAYVESDRDGWIKNDGTNVLPLGVASEDFNQNRQQGARLFVDWEFSDRFAAQYIVDYTDMQTTPAYFQHDFPNYSDYQAQAAFVDNSAMLVTGFAGQGNDPQSFPDRLEHAKSPVTGQRYAYELPITETIGEGHALILDWTLSDQVQFKSITGYRRFDAAQFQNFTEVFVSPPIIIPGVVQLFNGGVFHFISDLDIDNEQLTQEFQLSVDYGSLRYVAGLYYLDESGRYAENQRQVFNFPVDGGLFVVDSELESLALFGQATWVVDDRLELSVGLRYTEDERKATRASFGAMSFPAGAVEVDNDKLDYSLVADYAWSEQISLYLKYATGFRSGGASPRASVFSVGYDEETLRSYEAGVKSQLLDNRLRLNAAVFRADYKDIIIDFAPSANPGQVTGLNAGEGEIDGVELEVLYAPSQNLRLGLNYTYLNAEITDVNTPPMALGLAAASNYEFLWAPHNAYSGWIDYDFAALDFGQLSLHLDYSWQGEQFANATPTTVLGEKIITDDFGQINGRITLTPATLDDNSELQIALWGKNLTDADDVTYNLQGTGFSYQEPRNYGVDVIWRLK